MAACRLCHEDAKLSDSHIIPELLYKPLYDSKHRAIKLDDIDFRRRFLQKGLREELFCERCEQLLNDRYEKPFNAAWWGSPQFPKKVILGELYRVDGLDYASFKLFHLSVLFRAGIATHREFSNVSLGPHEERIRTMILTGDPGPTDRYGFFGQILFSGAGNVVDALITAPAPTRFDNHRAYTFIFGGCAWHYVVSGHSSAPHSNILFGKKGVLYLLGRV